MNKSSTKEAFIQFRKKSANIGKGEGPVCLFKHHREFENSIN